MSPASRREPPAFEPISTDLSELIEVLPEGFVLADADRTLLLANSRAEQLTGLPLLDRLGDDVTTALPLHDREHRSWWEALDPFGGLHTRTRFTEQLLHLPQGRAVLLAARIVRDPDRSVRRVVVTLRDPRTRERNDADSFALITTVAHELRAPLTSVRGFSRTLRQRWDQLRDEQKMWMLEAIEGDADRLSRLVSELLDVSRIDTGRLTLVRQPVDLLEIVSGQVAGLLAAGHSPDRFQVSPAPQPPHLWADPDRITQVVGNLLENAIRHGAGPVRVSIEQDRQPDGPDEVVLRVLDDGPGVPEEQRELVFSRFWQGRSRGGSGLGLYVVRSLVEAHGGRVAYEPAPSGGAGFVVRLPVGEPPPAR